MGMTETQENGYIECGECGHLIEQHTTAGCDITDCTCAESWTQAEIRRVRIREGLPGRWQS